MVNCACPTCRSRRLKSRTTEAQRFYAVCFVWVLVLFGIAWAVSV